MLVLASAGAVITAVATVLAAVTLATVAAVTTDKRLTKQIAAERERQERDLAAQIERQREALDSERKLADLGDLRSLHDEAAVALDAVRLATEKAHANVAWALSQKMTGEAKARLAQEAREALNKTGPPLVSLAARLRVRLGSHDIITDEFDAASGAAGEMTVAAAELRLETGGDVGSKAQEAGDNFARAEKAFTKAAVARVGTIVEGRPPSPFD
jgi:hypothetical protein